MPNEVNGNLDEIFKRMAQGLTRKQRIAANQKAMEPYEAEFRRNFKTSMNGHGDSILNTLAQNKTEGGAVELGFSKKGKKAYLARFQNDGWIPRNQYGGPYKVHGGLPMVPAKHFWEKTNEDAKHGELNKIMTKRQINYFKQVMDGKVHGGGGV